MRKRIGRRWLCLNLIAHAYAPIRTTRALAREWRPRRWRIDK